MEPNSKRAPLKFVSLQSGPGGIPYSEVHTLQKELVQARIDDEIPDTILFLEHAPVITRGRGLQWTGENRERNMPILGALPPGVDYFEVERGGDLTLHQPGQLVVYPIVKLGEEGNGFKKDIERFLRTLEIIGCEVLGEFGISSRVKPQATGVWVGEKKIMSLGIAVKKWVTYHGLALNITNDLSLFRLISPCGYSSEVMTRLADLSSPIFDQTKLTWRSEIENRMAEHFIRFSGASPSVPLVKVHSWSRPKDLDRSREDFYH